MKQKTRLLDEKGRIKIAALDHRGSLQKALHPENPKLATAQEMESWKVRMVALVQDLVTGILIDPIYGKNMVKAESMFGWMMSMEQTGYRGDNLERVTELLPNWSVRQARELGAEAVKLLLYYDPENKSLAARQKEVARKVAKDCQAEGLLFLLEPLSYKIEDGREREVLAIAEDLHDLPVDIWKFEYPGTSRGCENITKIVGGKPWVLLSAGMEYEKYRQALEVAMGSGASGFAVGRAVWQEFGEYQGQERENYLVKVARPRMERLAEIVNNA